ncbi:MAG: hypothetical protein IJX80_02025 [Clostridia bacterium]|nr:hypothetical protein [Clostridia bacterium]
MKHHFSKNEPRVLALNTHLVFYMLMTLLFLTLSVGCFHEREIGIGIILLLVSFLGVFVSVISPVCYLFSAKSVTIVYVLGDREIISWLQVRDVVLYGSFLSKHDPLPYYHLSYGHKKTKFYVNGEIVKTRKTKRLMKKYYKGTIL